MAAVAISGLRENLAYLRPTDIDRIEEAYDFSDSAHHGQTRKSGIPYISHPLAVAEIIAGKAGHVNYDVIPNVIYTSPEVASVGKTEEELKAANIAYNVGKFPFTANGKAHGLADPTGFVKVIADAKYGELLGAHLIGPDVSELIPELTLAQKWDLTVSELARNVHIHPTLSEALQECFHGLAGHMINF